jgi:hypothetical protein
VIAKLFQPRHIFKAAPFQPQFMEYSMPASYKANFRVESLIFRDCDMPLAGPPSKPSHRQPFVKAEGGIWVERKVAAASRR